MKLIKLFLSIGVYSAGWLSTGPNGVILSTMTNAFNTTNLISHDIDQGIIKSDEKKPGYSYIQSKLIEKSW